MVYIKNKSSNILNLHVIFWNHIKFIKVETLKFMMYISEKCNELCYLLKWFIDANAVLSLKLNNLMKSDIKIT